jgi:hypothetical protein
MNSIPKQLATFVAVLAVLFTGGAIAGQLIDADPPHDGAADASAHGAEQTHEKDSKAPSASHGAAHPDGEPEVHGLAVADAGLRLVVERPELRRGEPATLAYRIVDQSGTAVRDFDVTHEKRMHLILARRDLTGFQHLHPEMGRDGTWRVQVTLQEPGSYRLFADFSHQDESITLATDLRVDGNADLVDLPAPQPAAVSDGGYAVRLDSAVPSAGEESELEFKISRNGKSVSTEPYLGAGGHLVALREGDLAFLHVHPIEADEHGEGVGFAATFPTAGRYRLFLQFKQEGRVQTVAFPQKVSR